MESFFDVSSSSSTENLPCVSVLDHGFVRLVDKMGSDLSVVRAARVSYDAEWRGAQMGKSDEKLIHFLMRNRHTSPFEAVTFTFEVKAPLFVIRQWHRHRTWSYNEVSARYTELSDEFYVPTISSITTQSTGNKQQRTNEQHPEANWIREVMSISNRRCTKIYKSLLCQDVPRELARTILPVSIYTRMFATVNLLNLLKFIELRTDDKAQYEIQVYALAILHLIEQHVPVCVEAFRSHWIGVKVDNVMVQASHECILSNRTCQNQPCPKQKSVEAQSGESEVMSKHIE